MARQRKKHHFWRNLLILVVLFGIYLYWGNRSIETDEATFTSGALPAGFDGCRIVQLSDLHGKYFGKGNERLYSAVKAAHPEYIFVTGDLVDRKTENPTIYAGEVGAAAHVVDHRGAARSARRSRPSHRRITSRATTSGVTAQRSWRRSSARCGRAA